MAITFTITAGAQSISFTVPTDKQAKFQEAIMAACPKDSFSGTDLEWFGEVVRTFIKEKYKRGLQMLLSNSLLNTDDVIPGVTT